MKTWSRSLFVVSLLSLLCLPALAAKEAASPREAVDALPSPQPVCKVVKEKELMITDVSVVDDCARTSWGPCPTVVPPEVRGAWTFGKLVEGLAGTSDPEALSSFVTNWLLTWDAPQLNINGFDVPARPSMKTTILDPWLAASGGKVLDMKLAPFRLLAIVSRLDLRHGGGYGSSSAGEGRFVFGFLDENGNQLRGTVILEYGLKSSGCQATKTWAERWHALGSIQSFGETFNQALQAITDDFAGMNVDTSKPNGSGINQVRTNEIFADSPWELREYVLSAGQSRTGGPAPLVETTVKQTPEGNFDTTNWNGTQALADFINQNESAVLDGTYVVPAQFDGEHFLGAAARYQSSTFWSASGVVNNEARHLFSIGTCSGCHARETNTVFTHVDPRDANEESRISGFLSGKLPNGDPFVVTDPFTGEERTFGQLQVRAKDLCKLLSKTCKQIADEAPKSAVH